MSIKTITKSIGRFTSIFLMGMATSLTASSLMDIYYFFIQLKYTSGLNSLKLWLIGGTLLGIILAVISNVLSLRTYKQPKDIKLLSILLLRSLLTIILTMVFVLMIWNYYKFDYFRLKDAGPTGLLTGLIFGFIDFLNNTSISRNKETT